jgi:hypothetical protein
MKSILTLAALLFSVAVLILAPGDGPVAILLCAALAGVAGFFVSHVKEEKRFLLYLFVGGLLVRLLIGTVIYYFKFQEFFGGDALTYDFFAWCVLKVWQGDQYYRASVELYTREGGAGGWGMLYMIAAVYGLFGRNMLAIQYINAVLGAATAPLIFLCSLKIFGNLRAAKVAALLVAFYPSLILWSSQGLKDGPIVFMLCVSILATLHLGERFSFKYVLILIGALFALLSLRFYVFYIMVLAIIGAFIIGMGTATAQSFVRRFVVVMMVGLALSYVGASRMTSQVEQYGNLKAVQVSRSDLAARADSGYGKDVDVSTTSGALSAAPTGMLYLLFAPFPWQLGSLRQSITLPEMIVWWAAFPLLILGLWFTIKYRLRPASSILIFTSTLTLAYSLLQGNIGTAYRQRSQLLVFYFIFAAVGFELIKEIREDRARRDMAARQELAGKQGNARKQHMNPQPRPWNDLQDKPDAGATNADKIEGEKK